MNVDTSASIGPQNTTESNATVALTISTQTSSIPASSAAAETTVGTKAREAPVISVSTPDGGEELRVTSIFKAAQKEYPKSRPHSENDLIKQYGLNWLEASVARVDPKTGEKINKLRKSYEGQIKSFGLAGRNKATPHDSDVDGMTMLQLGQWPHQEYQLQRVMGKDLMHGLSGGVENRLEKALDLKPGKVPRNAEWENVLGHDKKGNTDDPKSKKQELRKEETQQQPIGLPKVNGHMNGITSNPETNRPKRVGKKRSYFDSSFEGYGEGYDDGAEDNSSNEGSRRSSSSRKKRRKSSNNLSPTTQSGSYGMGLPPQNTLSRGISSWVGRS